MKATGIIRRVDELGRIVLPIELRRSLSIKAGKDKENNTPLEIFVDGEQIILKKYEPACIFGGEFGELKEYKGKKVCSNCLKDMIGDTKEDKKDKNSIWRVG